MKILIIYAYAGIGHKKAADAVFSRLSSHKEISVENIDALDYTTKFFKFMYPRAYLFMIDRAPYLWGFFYYFFEIGIIDKVFSPIRRFFHCLSARRFIDFIAESRPDIVLCTHFLPVDVLSDLKEKGLFKGKLIALITDFLPHNFWIAKNIDYYIGCLKETADELIKRGIKEDKIKVLGIPCDEKFNIKKDKEGLIKKLGLKHGLFNILVMGGGFGTGPVFKIAKHISELASSIKDKIQLVVICGKNKSLFKRLEEIRSGSSINLGIFGYMDNVDEFMEISDLIVTKSGGLTTSEALSKRLPMIIIEPILGQETRNCDILTDSGVAKKADSVQEVIDHLKDLVVSPQKIEEMRKNIDRLSYSDASQKIAGLILNI
ncbi:MAG: glycosyltransferase [Candidatus Omnitrophota bacterium]